MMDRLLRPGVSEGLISEGLISDSSGIDSDSSNLGKFAVAALNAGASIHALPSHSPTIAKEPR